MLFVRKESAMGKRIIITGGGWAGCAAAAAAAHLGAQTTLLERTDMLLGTGLVGGIMQNNGRFTAQEECTALGGGTLFQVIEKNLRHKAIHFPGHHHASLYDVSSTPGAVRRFLEENSVKIEYRARISSVEMRGNTIGSVSDDHGRTWEGDVFLDTTGTAGPMNNCTRYGTGCAMCVLRCPAFGGRVSLTALTGIKEIQGRRADGSIGAMSGSCKLSKESLAPQIIEQLDREGCVVIPLPPELMEDHLRIKACQQYAFGAFRQNLVLLDTGKAKLMTPYFNLQKLHCLHGFENARYEDPYAGGKGNSIRFLAMAPRDNALQVQGIENLFCAGEKAGLLVGHTEAIVTGTLAGYNAVCRAERHKLLVLPRSLAVGEAIAFVREQMRTPAGLAQKYTFSGSVLLEHLKQMNLYTTDIPMIRRRVQSAGLSGIFSALPKKGTEK